MRLSAPIFRLKRQAKVLARETNAPLHAALDQVARQEGFRSWGHLAGSAVIEDPGTRLLGHLVPGDIVLLGGRPGHGKTLLGLQLAIEAARSGRPAFYFSLEDAEATIFDRLHSLGFDGNKRQGALNIDTSNSICADYILERVGCRENSLVVIDYLQLLDQKRENAGLSVQVATLAAFARGAPSTVVALSQIDRSFDPGVKPVPDLTDVRLPNPLELGLFTKACFLHDGELRVEDLNQKTPPAD
jgi:hypothetical protein